jgi:carboxylesterase
MQSCSFVKLQSVVGLIGPMLVFTEVDQTSEENKYWYRFRPQETITELNNVMKVVRKDLEDGVKLPTDTYLKVFHSLHDPLEFDKFRINLQRFKTSSGANIDVQLMDSDIHVLHD